jgi:cell division protease FtsH
MGWVKQVDLYDNSRNAIVQASSPELGNRIRVEIPMGASQLIQKLKEYNINFDAHPAPRKKYFQQSLVIYYYQYFIGSLIFFSKIQRFFIWWRTIPNEFRKISCTF